ncbi:hypothetical protein MRX96_051681 [Rhipicephalus microplus]
MIGKTSTALITFEGLQVPRYIHYYGAEYQCYVHRPSKRVCTVCLRFEHGSDNWPTPTCVTCKMCGLENPTPGHSCSPKCHSCGGDHPTTGTGCPARVRPPFMKQRIRKALQQEQQQRHVEHHPALSSSSQDDLSAGGSTPETKSRSWSRSRRGSRSKTFFRCHSRTGSQLPPVKWAATSEDAAPLPTNQSSLQLTDGNQPNKDQGAGA